MIKFWVLISILISTLSTASASGKIVSGEVLGPKNPGLFNAVALVKSDGKIFCTGSLVAKNLIATAKHCLVDKEGPTSFKIYFGDDTTKAEPTLYREVESYDTRYPIDWMMSFPSFDVAWVKFKGEAPEGFKPLPVLSDYSSLVEGMPVLQVGYGDNNPSPSTVNAGQKLWGLTKLRRHINNARFFHVLVFDGTIGQGSCHGDSGGPAYVRIEDQWYIIGVTNGFDLVLTPDAMVQTGDPDFPYNVDCAQNQSLYSFLGAHGNWIEETSNTQIKKSAPFKQWDRGETPSTYKNLGEWCESTDFGSPQWNLLKILLDKEVDNLGQRNASEFYEDCSVVVPFLESISRIRLDFEQVAEANLSFEPLKMLPRLKELTLLNYPKALLNLNSLAGINIETMTLKNLGIETLDFLGESVVKNLSLEQNPLYTIRGIEKVKGLESLNISGTSVKDLRPLSNIELKKLSIVGLNIPVVLGVNFLRSSLEFFDFRNTVISTPQSVALMTNLKEIQATGDNAPLNLGSLAKLERIYLKDFSEGEVTFPRYVKRLTSLTATSCDLTSLDFLAYAENLEDFNLTFNRINDLSPLQFGSFPKLRNVNLSGNPILNLTPMANLEALEVLRVFRTPIQRGQVPRTEQNCPTLYGPEVLRKFCAK